MNGFPLGSNSPESINKRSNCKPLSVAYGDVFAIFAASSFASLFCAVRAGHGAEHGDRQDLSYTSWISVHTYLCWRSLQFHIFFSKNHCFVSVVQYEWMKQHNEQKWQARWFFTGLQNASSSPCCIFSWCLWNKSELWCDNGKGRDGLSTIILCKCLGKLQATPQYKIYM